MLPWLMVGDRAGMLSTLCSGKLAPLLLPVALGLAAAAGAAAGDAFGLGADAAGAAAGAGEWAAAWIARGQHVPSKCMWVWVHGEQLTHAPDYRYPAVLPCVWLCHVSADMHGLSHNLHACSTSNPHLQV